MPTENNPSPNPWLKRVLQEPLVHFVILGGLIFGVDHALMAIRGNPQDIVVPKAAYEEARGMFLSSMKREPSKAELKVLADRWLDNEILYREGLALGLDKGDTAMRDRVIFKALSVTQAGLELPKIDEDGLRKWFEGRRERYDAPTRYDFQEAVLAGDTTPDKLKQFAADLNANQAPDTEASLRVFKDRPKQNLVQSYGASFAESLEKQAVGTWAVLQSQDGLRVFRLLAITPGEAVSYHTIKVQVYKDWKDDTSSQLSKKVIRDMAKKYRIRDEGDTL